MPTTLKNGDIALPCHVAFVLKKISGFDSQACSATIPITTVVRIKCSGIENREEVMVFLENELKCRINEVEFKVSKICNKT